MKERLNGLRMITLFCLILVFFGSTVSTQAQTADENIAAAKKDYDEAEELLKTVKTESMKAAREKYKAAREKYQAAGDRAGVGKAVMGIGKAEFYLEDKSKAIEAFNEAVVVFRGLQNKDSEADALNNLGLLYEDVEPQKALDFYEQALRLSQSVGSKKTEASILRNLGTLSRKSGNLPKALDYKIQALQLKKTLGDKIGEAGLLSDIGVIYDNLGDLQKAIDYYQQALTIYQSGSTPRDEATTLANIGLTYISLSEYQKALDYFNRAAELGRTNGYKTILAASLANIGDIYRRLGERQKALDYFNQAVPIFQEVGDKRLEASTLNNIGSVYNSLGNREKALEYYNRVLPMRKSVGDKRGEAVTLNNIGGVYNNLGDRRKALDYYNQALIIRREVSDRAGEATMLNNIGAVYNSLEDYRKAIEYYSRVLPLNRVVSDKTGEATTLNNLMSPWGKLKNSRFAIVYGKLSILGFQQLRSRNKNLDKESQQSYLKLIENKYRRLAVALLDSNRLAEAQQVLNLFKDQQYFDFNSTKQAAPLGLTAHEKAFFDDFDKRIMTIVASIRRRDELRISIGKRQPTETEAAQLKRLEADVQKATDDYQAFLKTAEAEFAAPPDDKDKTPDLADMREMQIALKELTVSTRQKTVAVYTLVGEVNYRALVITPDSVFSISTPIKAADLNQKALQLWSLLRTPTYDPQPAANEMYKIVFEPLASQLPKDTKTILWSLDGNLRYIPMAALHDGKKYLVERFENVIFTRTDRDQMTRAVNPNLMGTGFGSSEAQTIELLGGKFNASALPSVKVELGRIFKKENQKGVLGGRVLLDGQFTKTAMLAELKERRPLVHVASHFRFEPGDEARSFLVLGDGSPFTLEEMKHNVDLFSGVDLLTLSACQTAAQRADANGREVDGFAELAQRLGAGAVMASLWEVSDNSTAELMTRFYADYRGSAGDNKAEALRRAQLSLLLGKYNTNPTDDSRQARQESAEGIQLDESKLQLFRAGRKAPFAHPFYWAPFILIGNWK